MDFLLKHVSAKRVSADKLRIELLSKRFESPGIDFNALRAAYGDKIDKAFRISVTALVSCPFYSTFLSEESGAHYYRRGKIFERFLNDLLENGKIPGARPKSKDDIAQQVFLHTLVELDRPIKGFQYALIIGFADAIVRTTRGDLAIVEFKSSFAENPPVLNRIAQLSTYLRLYQRMYNETPRGFLVAYIENRDPPIAIRRVSITETFKEFVMDRIKAHLDHAKSPVDKTLCAICPIREHCEFRTGSPYRAF